MALLTGNVYATSCYEVVFLSAENVSVSHICDCESDRLR